MTVRLVVNADDFGMSDPISRGIVRAHREGIVTSTSLLGNCDDLRGAKALLDDAPTLGVGLHLTLVGGRPVSDPSTVPSLVEPDGGFPRGWPGVVAAWAKGRLRGDEVERELDAQISRARDAGLTLDHLDTHQHVGFLPLVGRAVEAVARRHGIAGIRASTDRPSVTWMGEPLRAAEAAVLLGLGWLTRRQMGSLRYGPATWGFVESGRLDEIRILEILGRLGPGDHELLCHPGESDAPLPDRDPTWRYQWTGELQALTSATIRAAITRRGITLCRWADLF